MSDTPAPAQSDPAAAFQRLLEKNSNDGLKLASQLFDENFQYRSQIRDLKDKLPKDGTVQLTADEAKQFQAYKDLGVEPKDLKAFVEIGKTAEELKSAVEKVPELERSHKELSQMESYREVAATHGYKVPVLKKLMAEHPDASFEIKTDKDKDGKETKVAFIRTGDKELPFTEFAEQNFADFLPALKQDAEPLPTKVGNTPDPPPAKGSDPTPADQAALAAHARSVRSHF